MKIDLQPIHKCLKIQALCLLCMQCLLNITWRRLNAVCFALQIFNGCPLKINCTASWIHPETHDQHILVGAEEGIYTLNLTELHENAMDLLYPRRTVWMFVIKDVLMTLSGKNPSLYRHDLFGLHTKQSDRLTISMNAVHKIPAKLMPKKFAMTSKVCIRVGSIFKMLEFAALRKTLAVGVP